MSGGRWRIGTKREVLLIELDRRCSHADCNARNRIGLTKDEAHAYAGFECERCERRTTDALTERDVPEWWEELAVTGLIGVRTQNADDLYEPSEVVKRISDVYRSERGGN